MWMASRRQKKGWKKEPKEKRENLARLLSQPVPVQLTVKIVTRTRTRTRSRSRSRGQGPQKHSDIRLGLAHSGKLIATLPSIVVVVVDYGYLPTVP